MTLTNRQKKRYRNALKKCARVNYLNRKGYTVFVDGELFTNKIELKDRKLLERVSGHVTYMLFEANPDFDHGLYDSIETWNKQFGTIEAVHPKHIKRY